MMSTQEVIATYEAMQSLTASMVDAASASDWDQLAILESRCAAHVQALKDQAAEQAIVLSGQERATKIRIIRQLLDDDRKIRDLTSPWMAHLSAMIGSTRSQSRLINTYGAV
jgi:flagellar protein FliT